MLLRRCDHLVVFLGTAELDDGGDATLLLYLGSKAEQDPSVLDNPGSEEEVALYASIRKKLAESPNWYSAIKANIQGVTEEEARAAFALAAHKLPLKTTFRSRETEL